MFVLDPSWYALALRRSHRVQARIEGVEDVHVDDLLDKVDDELARWCKKDPPADEQECRRRASKILRDRVTDHLRSRGRRGTKPLPQEGDEEHGGGELSDDISPNPVQSATDLEKRRALNAALARALDPSNPCYRRPHGDCLREYDALLVRRWKRWPDASMRRHGRFLQWYFRRRHVDCCDLGERHETFACRRMADILRRLSADEELRPFEDD